MTKQDTMEEGNLYCRASLPRSGLGNRLFAWARCRVFSRQHGISMFRTFWPQLTMGPTLRRESDPRIYAGIFLAEEGSVGFIRQLSKRLSLNAFPEPSDLNFPPERPRGAALITFAGMDKFFEPLNPFADLVRDELLAILRPKWRDFVDQTPVAPVMIQVRCGDFRKAQSQNEFITHGNLRSPVEWYVEALKFIRGTLGENIPASVISDGSDVELAPLLGTPGVERLRYPNAMTAMFLLSKSRFLIGTGGSSFCAWGAFLGKVPMIVIRGQNVRNWFKIDLPGIYTGEWMPNTVADPQLLRALSPLSTPAARRASR